MQLGERLLKIPALQRRLYNRPRARGAVVLDNRHIYIMPNRYGVLFFFVLMVMLIGSINYNNSLGFMLTFLLGSLAIVSILHTYRNLKGLSILPGRCESVFVGEVAHFQLIVSNSGKIDRLSVAFAGSDHPADVVDIAANGSSTAQVAINASRRGVLQPGRIKVQSHYPLGLFRAWSWIVIDSRCLVYPAAKGDAPLPLPEPANQAGGHSQGKGVEDFAGLRSYQAGDSPRHIAWKVAAHEGGLMTKQFTGEAQQRLTLAWDGLGALADEARLSQLCRWVLDAEKIGIHYGLRLPNLELQPGGGETHSRRCLEALALYAQDGVEA